LASEFIYKFVPASGSETTLLLLHGTGGDENDLVPVGRGTAKGAALLSPRGRVDENGMARFFRRVREGVFDEESIHKEAAALEGFVRDAAGEHGFDPTRVIAFGYSNGANMAAALMLLYPKLLAGAVLLRATLPLTPEPLLGLASTPVLILAGQHDQIILAAGTEKLAQTLSYAGARVEVRWQNLGHELGPEDFTAAHEFLKPLL
jgi:phospholipase/carboxylesterase